MHTYTHMCLLYLVHAPDSSFHRFQACPHLGTSSHQSLTPFLVLFSYVLTQVADPEQSNSLWSTDWLRGERGTLHLFLLTAALMQPLPFLPKQVGCDYGTLLCPYTYQQDPSVFPISAGMRCYECLCKLGR